MLRKEVLNKHVLVQRLVIYCQYLLSPLLLRLVEQVHDLIVQLQQGLRVLAAQEEPLDSLLEL